MKLRIVTMTAATVLVLATTAPVMAGQEPSAETGAIGAAATMRAAQEDRQYERATEALDQGRYQRAIELFQQVATSGSSRRDAATYWLAYAQNKAGDPSAALHTLAELRTGFPSSAWLDDGEYLEAEIRGASGQAAETGEIEDADMRLFALNSLMHVDSERAVPLLERILQGDESREMKERALFVLAQNDSDRAFEVLSGVARGGGGPELRIAALRYLGMFGQERALAVLDEVYGSTQDAEIKAAILQGFRMADDTSRLLRAARNESDPDLRVAAIRQLAMSGGSDELWSMYQDESSPEVKEAILQSMFMTGDSDRLVEIVRSESDTRLQLAALRSLGMMGGDDDEQGAELRGVLLEVYQQSDDPKIRAATIQALWMSGDAQGLIGIFEKETDPDLRREIVQRLSMMDSEEAVDFLIRLIEQ